MFWVLVILPTSIGFLIRLRRFVNINTEPVRAFPEDHNQERGFDLIKATRRTTSHLTYGIATAPLGPQLICPLVNASANTACVDGVGLPWCAEKARENTCGSEASREEMQDSCSRQCGFCSYCVLHACEMKERSDRCRCNVAVTSCASKGFSEVAEEISLRGVLVAARDHDVAELRATAWGQRLLSRILGALGYEAVPIGDGVDDLDITAPLSIQNWTSGDAAVFDVYKIREVRGTKASVLQASTNKLVASCPGGRIATVELRCFCGGLTCKSQGDFNDVPLEVFPGLDVGYPEDPGSRKLQAQTGLEREQVHNRSQSAAG